MSTRQNLSHEKRALITVFNATEPSSTMLRLEVTPWLTICARIYAVSAGTASAETGFFKATCEFTVEKDHSYVMNVSNLSQTEVISDLISRFTAPNLVHSFAKFAKEHLHKSVT